MNREELTGLFRKLGARDPEAWAESEIAEGIPQLERFLFLRQAWRAVVREGDTAWIRASVQRSQSRPREPYSGVGHALKRLLDVGATPEDVTEVVRGMQAELLFKFCYLLDDPGEVEPEARDLAWALVRVDAGGAITDQVIGGLHESVLETDPTGREMRPRS